VNFASPEAQNRRARHHVLDAHSDYPLAADHVVFGSQRVMVVNVVAWGLWIGMCGYTSVPEDGRTCSTREAWYTPGCCLGGIWFEAHAGGDSNDKYL